LVTGAAVILLEAAVRGDGGSATNVAADARTIKALLLNGAVKPADWSNPGVSPFDPRYGAGVLNVFNSYKQLTGGKHPYVASSSVSAGGPHPATVGSGNVSSLYGWDFNTNTSSSLPASDGVNHYYFNLTSNSLFTGTATLVWNRQLNTTGINQLDLYLYNATSGSLIALSSNTVDNVKHISVPHLPPGRYDLQVLKSSGNSVSSSETYALAFEFFTMPLSLTPSGNNVVITWPDYPAGFVLESTATPTSSGSWSAVSATPTVTNNQNSVTISTSSGQQFFRLNRLH
jgi:hypothetical protein